MERGPTSDDEQKPKHHFQFGLDFVRDQHTGIYKPKSDKRKAECPCCNQPIRCQTPLFVEIKRDVFAFTLTAIAAIVSAATLGVVATYTFYARGQWQEMRKATVATQDSANAAGSSARTAESTLKNSQQQFRTEQRPYLWAIPIEAGPIVSTPTGPAREILVPLSNGRMKIMISAILKNGGKSPAKEVVATPVEIKLGPKGKAANEAQNFIPRFNSPATLVLPGEAVSPVTPQYPELTKEEFGMLGKGDWELYIVGAVRYRDIFPPEIEPYETDYCVRYNPVGLPFSSCGFSSSIK